MVPNILYLSTRWRCVVGFMLGRYAPRERVPGIYLDTILGTQNCSGNNNNNVVIIIIRQSG
jgi:hypothetical protein